MRPAEILLLVFFPSLMAFAAASDLFTMTIPNRVSVLLLAGFAVMAGVVGMPLNMIGMHLLAGAVVFAVCFVFFACGWMGGGDAKLATATAVWIGWSNLLQYAALAALLGGLLTLGLLMARKYPIPPHIGYWPWLERLHKPDTGIPYGIALAAAGLVMFPSIEIWRAVVGV